jgi:Galactose-3-O-sulfotransferase
MGRVVRSLMKVPAVRRVMLRLANAEAAIAGQRAQLGQLDALLQRLSADEAGHRTLLAQISEHMPPGRRAGLEAAIAQQQAQLGHVNEHIRRLMADGADQRALLAEVAEHMPPLRLKQLEATIAEQHALLAEVANHMPPARQAEIEAAIKGQEAQIGALNQRIQQLSADHDGQRALLAEVSQHLPPAQRANLEATLHGQQLQLGALNSTIHANQIQLGALNDIVQRLSAENASQHARLAEVSAQVPSARLASLEATMAEQQARLGAMNDLLHQFGTMQQEKQVLAEKIAVLERENRLLKVGHGATFEELAASGKISLGAPYRFDDLLSLQQMTQRSAPSVPPLVHIHVPKAAGTTLNNILMRNYKYRADSYGTEFFPRYFPSEFTSLVSAPPTTGDRIRPMFFTGHIGLGNELFRRMPVRYVAITMLREPVSRVISHYRFNSTAPSIFQSAIQNDRLDVIEYFHRFRSAIPLQYEYFAQEVNAGEEAQPSRITEASRNLAERVSLFGIQDEFDEFVVLLAELLGLPDVFYLPLNTTPDNAAPVNQEQTEELRKLLADDIVFYDSAVSLYRQRTEALTFDLADRVKVFKQEKNRYLKLRNHRPHPWRDSYS